MASHGRCYKCHLKPPCVHFLSPRQLEESLDRSNGGAGSGEGRLVEHGGDEVADAEAAVRDDVDQLPSQVHASAQLTPRRLQQPRPAPIAADGEVQRASPSRLRTRLFSYGTNKRHAGGLRQPSGSPVHTK